VIVREDRDDLVTKDYLNAQLSAMETRLTKKVHAVVGIMDGLTVINLSLIKFAV